MKIKFYIVTYNREKELNETLRSLFNTDYSNYEVQFFIVNNHTSIKFNDKYADKVTVLENVFRPDNSTGHLSRNYNEIILHGIKDVTDPDCDILIHSHDDNLFKENFFSEIIKNHEQFDFITFSQGCGLCSYLPLAIDRIGLWDERFCTIGYHEGDYFLRALITDPTNKKTSINDPNQGREYNALPPLCIKQSGTHQNAAHTASFTNYSVCRQLWQIKWPTCKDGGWDINNLPPNTKLKRFMLYPYFEKKLSNLPEKYFNEIDAHGHPFLQ